MRRMSGRAVTIISRIVFALCGITTLLTAGVYTLLQGEDLPFQREWVLFAVILGLLGVFSFAVAVLPRSWTAKMCRQQPENARLYASPLKLLVTFAAVFYLVAVAACYVPHTWNLNPQIGVAVCPISIIRAMYDPSAIAIFLILAPMNAAAFGTLGLALAYVRLALRSRS